MISLRQQDNRFVIEFTTQDVSDEFLSKLLRKYKVDKMLYNNEMTEQDAWIVSEDIKDDWYKANKSWIHEKIGVAEDESDN